MKNIVKKLFLCTFSLILIFTITIITGCTNNETTRKKIINTGKINPAILSNNPESDKEILISYTLAGYGEDWIYQAVDAFNRVYEGHGYKAVIGRSDANFQTESMLTEIKYPKSNDYDLYFDISENSIAQLIDGSYSVLKSRNKVLLEELSDVFDSSPIDLNGYEEEGTIRSHMNTNTIMFDSYTTSEDSQWYNKIYGMSWTRGIAGFVINKDVLKQFGFEDVPRTTNELFSMAEYILANPQNSSITGNTIYPFTWPGANGKGYIAYSFLTWLGQWKGVQGYNDFYALNPATGTTIDNGYDVYDDIGIQYALNAMSQAVKQKYACAGTVTTIDHLMSEESLADGEALIAFTGDWCYNEIIGCGYEDNELTQIEMLAVPVLSELSKQIGLPGNDETQDKILSYVVKCLDEDVKDETIISDVKTKFSLDITQAQIDRIKEARGIFFDMGTTHNCLIPSYSDNIEGAKLFLRFIASKDFCETIYSVNAHAVTANGLSQPSQTNYLKSLARIASKPYSVSIGFADKLSEIRMKGGIGFTFEPYTHYIDLVTGFAYDSFTPETAYERIKSSMKNNWSVIISSAGLDE